MSRTQIHGRYQSSLETEPMEDTNDNSSHTQVWLQDNLDSMQLKRSEMNELIMDYLVHEGFKEAAERFREEAGIDLSNFGYSDVCSSGITRTNPTTFNNNNNNNNKKDTTNRTSSQSKKNVFNVTGRDKDPSGSINNHQSSSSSSSGINCPAGSSSSSQMMTMMMTTDEVKNTTDETTNGHNNITNTNTSSSRSSSCSWLTRIETAEMMDNRVEIRHHIGEGDILKAKSLINLHYPELLDDHRDLYFKLQQQHIIELIRQQNLKELLNYVQENLQFDDSEDNEKAKKQREEIEKTLALVAYPNPEKSPYAYLLKFSRRLQLASEINDIILQNTTGSVEPYKPRLVTLLKLLFWTQNELEKKKIEFSKMTDLVDGTIMDSRPMVDS